MRSHYVLILIFLLLMVVANSALAQTPDELIAIHKAQFDAMNAHDIDTMMSYWAEDSMYDLVSSPPPAPKPYVRYGFSQRFEARPDFRMTEVRILAAENIVVEEGVTHYTDGPTGAEVTVPHISIYEFEDSLIKKVTSYNDKVGPMIQRGEMPANEMPALVPIVEVPDAQGPGLSPVEANAEMVARWNRHDPAATAQMLGGDTQTFVGPMGTFLDRSQIAALNEMYFAGFSDTTIIPVRTIDLGDGWVVFEHVVRATHDGDFMGVPASGYSVEVRACWLTQYDTNGLVTQMSIYYDNLTLMNQMTTPPIPLDGIWLTAAPTPLGNWVTKTLYIAQDAAKTRYSGTLEAINAMPLMAELYPDADPALFFSVGGQAEAVGRDKYLATYLSYERKIDHETGSVVIVGMNTLEAHFEVIAPDQLHGQGTAAYYLASQDADGDGFPDEGQEPVACFPWQWTSKRLMPMPGCTPPQ